MLLQMQHGHVCIIFVHSCLNQKGYPDQKLINSILSLSTGSNILKNYTLSNAFASKIISMNYGKGVKHKKGRSIRCSYH